VVYTDAIIDTRGQKWLATQQRNLHVTNMEWSKTFYHPHNCNAIH